MNRLTQFVILWSLAISIGSAQETATIPDVEQHDISSLGTKVTQLRTDSETANKQAHDLAESLRQKPDAAKKSELRTAVQQAFTLRQSLLRAELQELRARLEKTC